MALKVVVALAVLYYFPLWAVLAAGVVLAVVRMWANKRHQNQLEMKLRFVRQKLRRQPCCDFTASYQEIDPERVEFIISRDATELAECIARGQVRAVEATLAYIKAAQAAQEKSNCLTVHRFEEALKEAAVLDQYQSETGQLRGPLHGVPFSVKDGIGVKGLDSTLGIMKYCFHPAAEDAVVVKVLKEAGAIPIAKTNVHQLVMGYECSNPVYGTTTNPWDSTRTPGGSSGGDAALLAARGAAFGLGTDIGGSLRIPAHYCGLYTLKPTGKQISMKGCVTGVPGQEAIVSNLAPICRSARDLELVVALLLGSELLHSLDPTSIPVPFKIPGLPKRKLRIGYYEQDGYFEAHSSCARAVRDTVATLASAGHEVVPFTPPKITHALHTYFALMVADGSKQQNKLLEGEVIDDTLKTLLRNRGLPQWVVRGMAAIYGRVFGWTRMAGVFVAALPKTVAETWQLQKEKSDYRHEFINAWKLDELDCVICPVHTLPAIKLGSSRKMLPNVSYTALYNLLDFPAGVAPVTLVTEKDESNKRTHKDLWDKEGAPSEVGCSGLPIGVQVVTLPFHEEMCVSVLNQIGELIPFTYRAK